MILVLQENRAQQALKVQQVTSVQQERLVRLALQVNRARLAPKVRQVILV